MVISKNLLNQILDWDCTIPNCRFSLSHFTYTQSMVIAEGFLLSSLSFYLYFQFETVQPLFTKQL